MKTTKTVWHALDPAAFDEELGKFNEMSRQGWQLAELRMSYQKYRRDERAVYRYAIDFQEDMSRYETERYRTEFGEQGWEYVTGRGDWHIFRKRYDPALPETAYRIYTDEPSFREMKESGPQGLPTRRGWVIGWGVVLLLLQAYNMVISPSLSMILLMASVLIHMVCAVPRNRHYRRMTPEPKPYRFHLWRYSFIFFLVLYTLAIAAWCVRAEDTRLSGPAAGRQSVEFTVKLPDFYGLIPLIAEEDTPAAAPVYSLTNKDGEVIKTGFLPLDGGSVNLFLPAGRYTLTVDWDAAAFPGAARETEAEAAVRLGSYYRGEPGNRTNRLFFGSAILIPFYMLSRIWGDNRKRRLRI